MVHRCLGLGMIPAAALGQMPAWPGEWVTKPLRDGSLDDSAAVAHAGKDLPAPPSSPMAASWETKAPFVLSQVTKETGKTLNFGVGSTAPTTPSGACRHFPSAARQEAVYPRVTTALQNHHLAQANTHSIIRAAWHVAVPGRAEGWEHGAIKPAALAPLSILLVKPEEAVVR